MLVASAGSVACQCLMDAVAVLSLKAFSSVHFLVSGGKLAIEIDKNVRDTKRYTMQENVYSKNKQTNRGDSNTSRKSEQTRNLSS